MVLALADAEVDAVDADVGALSQAAASETAVILLPQAEHVADRRGEEPGSLRAQQRLQARLRIGRRPAPQVARLQYPSRLRRTALWGGRIALVKRCRAPEASVGRSSIRGARASTVSQPIGQWAAECLEDLTHVGG